MKEQALKLLSVCTVLLMVIIKSKVYCENEQKPVVLFNMKCDGPKNKNCVSTEYDDNKFELDGSYDKEDKMSLAKRFKIIDAISKNKENDHRSYKLMCHSTSECIQAILRRLAKITTATTTSTTKRSPARLRVACVPIVMNECIPVEGLYIG